MRLTARGSPVAGQERDNFTILDIFLLALDTA
jgi:hypothetical protein